MPPNRKSPTQLTSSVELRGLNIPLKAKFLPLTDPKEATQRHNQDRKYVQQELIHDPKIEKPIKKVSYWDWPSDTAEEERLDDLFSLSRLESNLITDSIRREKEDNCEGTREYQSYWDWSNKDVDDNEPDVLLKGNTPTPQTEIRNCEECCEDYWTWHQDEVPEEKCSNDSPSCRLHEIMIESQKKYTRRHSHLPEPENGLVETNEASDHYWHWLEFRSTNS